MDARTRALKHPGTRPVCGQRPPFSSSSSSSGGGGAGPRLGAGLAVHCGACAKSGLRPLCLAKRSCAALPLKRPAVQPPPASPAGRLLSASMPSPIGLPPRRQQPGRVLLSRLAPAAGGFSRPRQASPGLVPCQKGAPSVRDGATTPHGHSKTTPPATATTTATTTKTTTTSLLRADAGLHCSVPPHISRQQARFNTKNLCPCCSVPVWTHTCV